MDSLQLRRNSSSTIPNSWTRLWMTTAKLLFRASEMVSTSLVNRLIRSPFRFWSKKRRGRVWSRWYRSRRMSRRIFWAARTMIWV